MTIILDSIVLVTLAYCTWKGWRRGLIMSVAGILALFIAFWGSNILAERYSPTFEDALRPFIGGVVDSSVDSIMDSAQSTYTGSLLTSEVQSISKNALGQLGILTSAADAIVKQIRGSAIQTADQLKSRLIDILVQKLAYVITLTVAFVLILIAITIISNILNVVVSLPVLKQLNGIGGLAFGFFKGILFVLAIGWVLRFAGFAIPEKTIESTILMKIFVNHNLLTGMFEL